jgi:hypothetical protein
VDDEIILRDRHERELFRFRSQEFKHYMGTNNKISLTGKPASEISPDQSSSSRAVRTVRRILGVIEVLAVIAAIMIIICGLVVATYMVQVNSSLTLPAVGVLALSGLTAFLLFWSNRFFYSILELLADIAEDVRLIRISNRD